MTSNCSRVCWCYPLSPACWGATLWFGYVTKNRSAPSRSLDWDTGGLTSASYGAQYTINNQCANYISRSEIDDMIGPRSAELAKEVFSRRDVHLDLNMTMIRPLDALQQAE